jgi:hypothetical protein
MASETGVYRTLTKSMDKWDMPLLGTVRPESLAEIRRTHSEKRLAQTGKEFYEEIDRTVAELGISAKELASTVNRFQFGEKTTEEREKLAEKLLELLIPVYAALREKGYSRHDLVA